jgi:hypothetical protein
MFSQYIASVSVAVAFVIFCVEVLRRGYVQEKFAISWLTASLVALILALFPKITMELSSLLSIKTPVNFLFFFSITFLAAIVIQLILEIGRMKIQIQVLAEKIAQGTIRKPHTERDND